MNKTTIYLNSDIKSIRQTKGNGAWLFAWNKPDGTPGTKLKYCELDATASMAEIILLADALTWLNSFGKPCQVTVYLNNPHAYKALTGWMEEWKAKDWQNSKREGVSEWYRVLDRCKEPHGMGFCIEKGEYTNWLAGEVIRRKGEKGCLISLESLTPSKSSTQQPKG